MPRGARHTVTWHRDDGCYVLASGGATPQRLGRGDDAAWQAWLVTVTAFAFRGDAGSVGVRREARARAHVMYGT